MKDKYSEMYYMIKDTEESSEAKLKEYKKKFEEEMEQEKEEKAKIKQEMVKMKQESEALVIERDA